MLPLYQEKCYFEDIAMTNLGKTFDLNRSILRDVYVRFDVKDPGELQKKYFNADQKLMLESEWDYENKSLLPNQIRDAIEAIGITNVLDVKEREWIRQIMWLWYHHAISCAIWRYSDKNAALAYSAKALELRSVDHPNKITRLLYLLVRGNLTEAEEWAKTIVANPEKETAQYLLELYRENKFFEPQT